MSEIDPNASIRSATSLNDATSAEQPVLADRLKSSRLMKLLEVILVFSPAVIAILVIQAVQSPNPLVIMVVIWLANATMLVLIWAGIRIRGEACDSIGLDFRRPSGRRFIGTVLKSVPVAIFALVAFGFGSVVMANLVGIPESADMSNYNYLQGNLPMLLASLASVYVISSLGEEVIYRGFLITRLEQILGDKRGSAMIAVLFSSLVFGVAHFQWGAMGVGQTTCMGAALGISYLATKRNLWPLVLAHAYMDTLLLVPLYFAPPVS